MRFKKIFFLLFIIPLLISCKPEKPEVTKRIVIALSADVETINPLYAFTVDEGTLTETLFLSLIQFEWDNNIGDLIPKQMLATSWQWASDSSFVIFDLRNDVYWSDGQKFSASDVVYSFDIYSDPKVQSRLYGSFKNFYTDNENHVDKEKTFEILSPVKIKIKFLPGSVPSLLDVIFPVIPKHVFEKINRESIPTAEINFNPVTSGGYKLKKWERNQVIVLEANKKSFFYKNGMIDEVLFKIVPDYNSRLTQLKKGEIDFCELIQPSDAADLKKLKNLIIEPVTGREYDYIGWNNIDGDHYKKSKSIKPNKLFGNPKVRLALSYAVNREEILSEYLNEYGQAAVTPVSPIFKKYFNERLKPIEFNPTKTKELLKEEGWQDLNRDGILEKGNTNFSFILFIPSGNPLREYAATIIKNNLKAVGIGMKVEKLELGAFIDNILDKKIDAWMASWYIQVPLELKSYWHSDLEKTPLNFSSYRNNEVDKIIEKIETRLPLDEKTNLITKFQEMIYDDQPATFLYWTDNIVVHNSRIIDLTIDPLGAIQKIWEWRINN